MRVVPSPAWAAAETDVLVVAVKPDDVGPALESCAASLPAGALVLSIAAGVTLATSRRRCPGTPSCARCRTRPRSSGRARPRSRRAASPTDAHLDARRARARRGRHRRARSRELLDAVTGLSGSGPAYVFLVAEALIEAGVLVGLPRDVAAVLVRQTLAGSAALLGDGSESPEALRAAVTSPGVPPRPGCRCSRSTACAPRSWLRSTPRPTGRELGRAGD